MQPLGLLDVVLAVALDSRREVGAVLVAHLGQEVTGVEHVSDLRVALRDGPKDSARVRSLWSAKAT